MSALNPDHSFLALATRQEHRYLAKRSAAGGAGAEGAVRRPGLNRDRESSAEPVPDERGRRWGRRSLPVPCPSLPAVCIQRSARFTPE